jgi:hypothetical protein
MGKGRLVRVSRVIKPVNKGRWVAYLGFRGLGGERRGVFPGQSEDAEFCGCWLVRARWLKSGGDDDAAELGGDVAAGGTALDPEVVSRSSEGISASG